MKKTVFFTICLAVICFQAIGLDSSDRKPERADSFRFSGEVMIPFLPGFSSLGIGVNYGLSKRLDAFAEFSILPVAFKDETFNFHSTGGVRFYLSPKTNSFYLEAGGGLFGGISNDGSGIMPAATGNFGYEFEVKRFTMNVDLGVFYFLDSFISFPLPAVTASFFF